MKFDIPLLILDDANYQAQVRGLARNPNCVVSFTDALGSKPNEVRRLAQEVSIHHLCLSRKVTDYQTVLSLRGLRSLQIFALQNQAIDLGQFAPLDCLKVVLGDDPPLVSDVILAKHLELSFYDPKSRDLTELGLMPNLRALRLHQCRLKTLGGLSAPRLAQLRLWVMRSLAAVGLPPKPLKNVRWLEIDSCRSLESMNFILDLKALERLSVSNVKLPLNFSKLPRTLSELRIDKTEIVPRSLGELLKYPKLKRLYINPWRDEWQVVLEAVHRMRKGKIDFGSSDRRWPYEVPGMHIAV